MCTGTYEGPWCRARGNELGVIVSRLSPGESVSIELDGGESFQLESGYTAVDSIKKAQQYRVLKHVQDGAVMSPTMVEIHIDG